MRPSPGRLARQRLRALPTKMRRGIEKPIGWLERSRRRLIDGRSKSCRPKSRMRLERPQSAVRRATEMAVTRVKEPRSAIPSLSGMYARSVPD
jgi:hypothetical protein